MTNPKILYVGSILKLSVNGTDGWLGIPTNALKRRATKVTTNTSANPDIIATGTRNKKCFFLFFGKALKSLINKL